jgi:hypothetical protein
MTLAGNGQPTSYQVSMSGETRSELKRLHRRAIEAGTGHKFVAALRLVLDHLEKDPKGFGEPLYRLPTLNLAVRKGVISPLVVVYGVHDHQPLVFIRGFKVLSQ